MLRLVIFDDEGSKTVVPLTRDEITIGRKQGNTIRLTERNISRYHARLVRSDDGVYRITDLGSYNSITVNGANIEGETELKSGDELSIGDYKLVVEMEGADLTTVPDLPSPVPPPPTEPSGNESARLVMLSPPHPGEEYELSTSAPMQIGRSEQADIAITHRSVSRDHAEVRSSGGEFAVLDRGSSNGIRVNGERVPQQRLRSGDIVEVGDVAFRFVAAGEAYRFDPADAAAYAVEPGASAVRQRLPIIAAAAATAAAVAVIGLLVTETDDPSGAPASTEQVEEAAAVAAEQAFGEALDACRAALQAGQYDEALDSAARALSRRPDDAAARRCERQARQQQGMQRTFTKGSRALAAGDLEQAHEHFSSLPEDSPWAERPEVGQAARELADERLQQARQLLDSDRAQAARLADAVLAMNVLGDEQRKVASEIKDRARRQPAATASGAQASGKVAARQGARRRTAARGGSRRAQAGARKRASRAVSPMVRANRCLAKGDNQCVVRALEGRARTAQELGLLIETYRSLGDSKRAHQKMAKYIERFPTARRATTYRRMLERARGGSP